MNWLKALNTPGACKKCGSHDLEYEDKEIREAIIRCLNCKDEIPKK